MRAPIGVVPGLCTTASAFLATGSAILGYLIKDDHDHITPLEAGSFLTMLVALFFIGVVPWLVSKPVNDDLGVNLQPARKSLAAGTLLFFVAMLFYISNIFISETNISATSGIQQIQKNLKGN